MPPKANKVPKPKVRPAAKRLSKAQTKDDLLKEDKDGVKKLDDVLDQLFKCYDADEDGQIERVEYLDAEEKRSGQLGFGPKERKAAFAWFKEAGADGNPSDGMFLSPENFKKAFKTTACTKSGVLEAEEPGKLAEFIFEEYGKPLIAACYPEPAAGAAGSSLVPGAPREYPLTCTLSELNERMKDASGAGRNCLVLSSGLEEVETFMSYQHVSAVDSKLILNETLIKKSVSKADAQEKLRAPLQNAMGQGVNGGFCRPLWIRMANTAFDWSNFTSEEHFPDDLFSNSLWSIENAHRRGFIDEGQKFNAEVDDEKKWKDFQVIITSTFNLESANQFLFDKIPHFDELAIIVIDPASVQ